MRLRNRMVTPGLEELSEEEVIEMIDVGIVRSLDKGEALITEGEMGDTVYLVLDGKLAVTRSAPGGPLPLATLGKGDWVGEIAFTTKAPRTATVTASSTVTVIGFDDFTLERLGERIVGMIRKKLTRLAESRLTELGGASAG